jgi:hypothetical protein
VGFPGSRRPLQKPGIRPDSRSAFGGVDGFVRNVDSIAVDVVRARTGQELRLKPGGRIPIEDGDYRVGTASAQEFEAPPFTASVTWEVGRHGVRTWRATDVMPGYYTTLIIALVVLAAGHVLPALGCAARALHHGRRIGARLISGSQAASTLSAVPPGEHGPTRSSAPRSGWGTRSPLLSRNRGC